MGDLKHMGTFAVMLLVGFVIGNLTERIRAQMRLARTREQRLRALFRLTGELIRTYGSEPMMNAAIRILADHFQSRRLHLPARDRGPPRAPARTPRAAPLGEDELGVAQWVYDHHEAARLGTDTLPGARALYLPLKGAHGLIGVMGIQPLDGARNMEPDQRHLWRPSPTRPPWPWSAPSCPRRTRDPAPTWTGSRCAALCSPRSPTTCAPPWAASPAPRAP